MAGGGSIVREWLCSLGLAQYYQSFYDNGYDELEICKAIGQADLDAIGVRCVEHQRTLLGSVRTMREEGATSVYFTLEPAASASAPAKLPEKHRPAAAVAADLAATTSRPPPPPPQHQPPPPPPPHPSSPSADCETDKYAEGKTALARGGDVASAAAAAAAAALAWDSARMKGEPATRRCCAGAGEVDDNDDATAGRFPPPTTSSQSTPGASPVHACHRGNRHTGAGCCSRCHGTNQQRMESGRDSAGSSPLLTPAPGCSSARTVEHTCGRAGSVRVPTAGTAALAPHWQHRRGCDEAHHQRCLSSQQHPRSAPVTPAHSAAAAAATSANRHGSAAGRSTEHQCVAQQQQQLQQQLQQPLASTVLTHEERMRVLCEMTQGQLSVGEAVALLSQKRKPSEDTAVAAQKKTTEKRSSNFLKLLSFRKGKKSSQGQESSDRKSQKQQRNGHDSVTIPATVSAGEVQQKVGNLSPKQQLQTAGTQAAHVGTTASSRHCTSSYGHCSCTQQQQRQQHMSSGSALTTQAMSRSQMPSHGRLLSYDGSACGTGGGSSTSSGSLISVAAVSGAGRRFSRDERNGSSSASIGGGSGCVPLPNSAHRALFYSPQVARRHYDPMSRRWTEDDDEGDGDDDDSVWLQPSPVTFELSAAAPAAAANRQRRLPARSPTVDFTGGGSSIIDRHGGFDSIDRRKRDSGCYGSGDCLHAAGRVSGGGVIGSVGSSSSGTRGVGGGGGGSVCKLSISSSSVSSHDSCTGPVTVAAAAAGRPDDAVAHHRHHHRRLQQQHSASSSVSSSHACDSGSVHSLSPPQRSSQQQPSVAGVQMSAAVAVPLHLTQLFRGLDLDMALRLQQHGISLHESPYTTADGRWSVPPAVVIKLAQEIAINAQEACAIIDRVRVKLLVAMGKPAVALEMSFQGPMATGQQPMTVNDFLLKAGLPGYAGLFSLHGYDTVELVATMKQADVVRCGISDIAHVHTLLSHVDELHKPNRNGAVAGNAVLVG